MTAKSKHLLFKIINVNYQSSDMTAISCRTAISDADTDTINYTVPLSNYIESGLQYPEYPTQSPLIKSADIKACLFPFS